MCSLSVFEPEYALVSKHYLNIVISNQSILKENN